MNAPQKLSSEEKTIANWLYDHLQVAERRTKFDWEGSPLVVPVTGSSGASVAVELRWRDILCVRHTAVESLMEMLRGPSKKYRRKAARHLYSKLKELSDRGQPLSGSFYCRLLMLSDNRDDTGEVQRALVCKLLIVDVKSVRSRDNQQLIRALLHADSCILDSTEEEADSLQQVGTR